MTLTATIETAVDHDDETVQFHYRLRNTGTEPVTWTVPTTCEADLRVWTTDETEVWRYSAGRMFAQVITTVSIDAKDERSYEFTWTDPEPGTYVAEASLCDTAVDCTAKTTVTIPE